MFKYKQNIVLWHAAVLSHPGKKFPKPFFRVFKLSIGLADVNTGIKCQLADINANGVHDFHSFVFNVIKKMVTLTKTFNRKKLKFYLVLVT